LSRHGQNGGVRKTSCVINSDPSVTVRPVRGYKSVAIKMGIAPAPPRSTIRGMTKRPFGKTGLSVSPLGFGAAPIGYLQTDQDRVARILNLLLDSGVNLI